MSTSGGSIEGESHGSRSRRSAQFVRQSAQYDMSQAEQWELEDLLGQKEEVDNTPTWKKYARLVLPHVGLILLSCFYIVAGAGIFWSLERPHEITVREQNLATINSQRRHFLRSLWLSSKSEISEKKWRQSAMGDIENITRMLFSAFDTHYITAQHLNKNDTQMYTWTFQAAIFFTSTLLTTIGYGNLVPVTFEGRMFCICYGLFGVPLILITVADIGKFLSENIVWLYCRYVELKKKFSRKLFGRRLAEFPRGGEAPESGDEEVNEMRHELEKFGLEEYISIPVSLVLIILVGYIAIGALLLGSLENWQFFPAFYFSFITMTTVGFGDLVPVKESYFLLDLLYIIIGLAITTMCIDLVGIQYIRKIHYFGRAIQDARYALVNVGGRMVHVGDLMKYANVLHKKYGLPDPNAHIIENPMIKPDAYIPRDARGHAMPIRYIDSVRKPGRKRLVSSEDSIQSLHSPHSSCSDQDYGSMTSRNGSKVKKIQGFYIGRC